jgi:hypothetical protein
MTPVPGLSKINNFFKKILVLFLMGWFLLLGTAFAVAMNNDWAVQLGSFKKQENAQDFIRKIKKKGYTPYSEKRGV